MSDPTIRSTVDPTRLDSTTYVEYAMDSTNLFLVSLGLPSLSSEDYEEILKKVAEKHLASTTHLGR